MCEWCVCKNLHSRFCSYTYECLSVTPSASLSDRLHVCLSLCLSVCLFVCLPVCLSVWLCLPVCLPVDLFICCVCLRAGLHVYLPRREPACLSLSAWVPGSSPGHICLSVFSLISLTVCVCQYVLLSACPSVSLHRCENLFHRLESLTLSSFCFLFLSVITDFFPSVFPHPPLSFIFFLSVFMVFLFLLSPNVLFSVSLPEAIFYPFFSVFTVFVSSVFLQSVVFFSAFTAPSRCFTEAWQTKTRKLSGNWEVRGECVLHRRYTVHKTWHTVHGVHGICYSLYIPPAAWFFFFLFFILLLSSWELHVRGICYSFFFSWGSQPWP